MSTTINDGIGLSAMCHAVLGRLDFNPKTAEEWEVIREALARALGYARRMRNAALERERVTT